MPWTPMTPGREGEELSPETQSLGFPGEEVALAVWALVGFQRERDISWILRRSPWPQGKIGFVETLGRQGILMAFRRRKGCAS